MKGVIGIFFTIFVGNNVLFMNSIVYYYILNIIKLKWLRLKENIIINNQLK